MAKFYEPDGEWYKGLALIVAANQGSDGTNLIYPAGCEKWVRSIKKSILRKSINPFKESAITKAGINFNLFSKDTKKENINCDNVDVSSSEFLHELRLTTGDVWFGNFYDLKEFSDSGKSQDQMPALLISWCQKEFRLHDLSRLGKMKMLALKPYVGRFQFYVKRSDSLINFANEISTSNNKLLTSKYKEWIINYNYFVSIRNSKSNSIDDFSLPFRKWCGENYRRMLSNNSLSKWRKDELNKYDFISFCEDYFQVYKNESEWLKTLYPNKKISDRKSLFLTSKHLNTIIQLIKKGQMKIVSKIFINAGLDPVKCIPELISFESSNYKFTCKNIPNNFKTSDYEMLDRVSELNERFRGMNGQKINKILKNLLMVSPLSQQEIEAMNWTSIFIDIKSKLKELNSELSDEILDQNQQNFISVNSVHFKRGSMDSWRKEVLVEIGFESYFDKKFKTIEAKGGDVLLFDFYKLHGSIKNINDLASAELLTWKKRLVQRIVKRVGKNEINIASLKVYKRLSLLLPEVCFSDWEEFFLVDNLI